ncbi:Protein of unknown function [Lactobacillus delbrueckii subsp. bulgaricus]|nr:Protein of unknown function [Lactobacillus delbrueckii subsp. bulgaricus]
MTQARVNTCRLDGVVGKAIRYLSCFFS